jgi:hypothetical protein
VVLCTVLLLQVSFMDSGHHPPTAGHVASVFNEIELIFVLFFR